MNLATTHLLLAWQSTACTARPDGELRNASSCSLDCLESQLQTIATLQTQTRVWAGINKSLTLGEGGLR